MDLSGGAFSRDALSHQVAAFTFEIASRFHPCCVFLVETIPPEHELFSQEFLKAEFVRWPSCEGQKTYLRKAS
ncbi:MAG: hypothetical protein DMF72_06720 [Acidobacteria bacterium]|nr:MAG: hypothetical protein DMF72_06720 [Acidobacteriota bacterium]